MNAPTDDDLMIRINTGEVEESLAILKSRYGQRIHNFVKGIVRDEHLAEDVGQEVFAKVFFKSHLYRPGSNFHAWLFEVARNQALSALRTRRLTPRPIGSLEMPNDGADDGNPLEKMPAGFIDRRLEEQELMYAFSEAVEHLPERYRDVFELCVQQGRQYQEAAKALNIPTGTVAIRIQRARKRLYKELAHHMDRLRRPPACLQ